MVGADALSGTDRQYLAYETAFERRLLDQGRAENRTLDETLDRAWDGPRRAAPTRADHAARRAGRRARRLAGRAEGVSAMDAKLRGLPPGRAGRMWLTPTARRGDARGGPARPASCASCWPRSRRFALLAERTQGEWEAAVRDLERWMLRATLLSGERGLRLAADGGPAEVEVAWRQTMGVRYPARASCQLPRARPRPTPSPDNTALRACGRRRPGGRCAPASTTRSPSPPWLRCRAEIVSTRRQLRAVRDRWTPTAGGGPRAR